MSQRTNLLTLVPDVDLKWTTWVDYLADPRYADGFPVFDDFVYATTYERPVDEMIFTTDAVDFSTGFTRTPADAVVMGDVFSFDATYIRGFADAMVVTDNATMILGTTATVNYSDTVTMAEAFGSALTMPRSLADSVVMSEAFSSISTVALNFADSTTLSDVQQFDPYWPFVEALFHFDVPPGGSNNYTFLDSSLYAKTVQNGAGGFVFQGTVSPYTGANTNNSDYSGIGGSSYFGAVGPDFLTVPQSDHFHFPAGTDFTIECWFMVMSDSVPDGSSSRHGVLFATRGLTGDGWNFAVLGDANTTGTGLFFEKTTGGVYDITGGGPPVTKRTWHHAAVCRAGTTTRMFLDGVALVTYTFADQNLPADNPLTVGMINFGSGNSYNRPFKGYIADVRVSKGAAYYVSNFTPPTTKTDGSGLSTALKLEFSNAAILDSARKSDLHTDGSYPQGVGVAGSSCMYFDGSNRNVQTPFALPVAERFAVMHQDFTVETWFWLAGDSAQDPSGFRNAALISTWSNGGPSSGWSVLILGQPDYTGSGLRWHDIGNGDYFDYYTAITKSIWHHVAVSRINGVYYMHLDGALVATHAPSTLLLLRPAPAPYAGPLLLGMTPDPSYREAYFGYLDDFRLTIGKARYGNANIPAPFNAPFPNGVAKYSDRYVLQFFDSVTMSEAGTFDMPASTTFDPALVGSVITLSGGNLIASRNSGAQYNCARSTTGKTTGKWYAEMKPVAGSSGDIGFGVGRASFALTATYPGSAAPSLGFRNNGFGNNDGAAWASGAADLTVANGGTVFICVDASAGLVWLAKNGGSTWNNNGAANPATGVGGLVLSGSGAIHLLTGMYTPPDQVSLNCGQSAFVGAIPSGFSRWG